MGLISYHLRKLIIVIDLSMIIAIDLYGTVYSTINTRDMLCLFIDRGLYNDRYTCTERPSVVVSFQLSPWGKQ